MGNKKDVIISFENVNKKFKSKTILEDISFSVNRGEFLSFHIRTDPQ